MVRGALLANKVSQVRQFECYEAGCVLTGGHWQIRRMSRANSSDKALARLVRLVLSVTIWRVLQTTFANTLLRSVLIPVSLLTPNLDLGKL
jgi:hypothetical protein